jgi:hypothetical protein
MQKVILGLRNSMPLRSVFREAASKVTVNYL